MLFGLLVPLENYWMPKVRLTISLDQDLKDKVINYARLKRKSMSQLLSEIINKLGGR